MEVTAFRYTANFQGQIDMKIRQSVDFLKITDIILTIKDLYKAVKNALFFKDLIIIIKLYLPFIRSHKAIMVNSKSSISGAKGFISKRPSAS